MKAAIVVLLAASAEAGIALRKPAVNSTKPALNSTDEMVITPHAFTEVNLGPFANAQEACEYCFSSYTKKGNEPAGPVAPFCVCMAYPENGQYNMFCATPQTAAGYVGSKGGCRCKEKDMEAMGQTTCKPIE